MDSNQKIYDENFGYLGKIFDRSLNIIQRSLSQFLLLV